MNLDVRIPMGLMFGLIGAMLAVYGLMSPQVTDDMPVKININLYWGLVMFAFGLVSLMLAWGAKKSGDSDPAGTSAEDPGAARRGH